jgi:uncharacterized membrane protein YoaK (UPF0700 family)
LLALAFSAGYIDSLSYLGLGRVFTANMTGNTVLLGIAIATLDQSAALRSGLALAGFLGGAALAARIVQRDHSAGRWPRAVTGALMLEGAVLAAFAFGWTLAAPAVLIVLSAIAMGMQSAAVHRLELSGITTTYITGTLTNMVSRLLGRERRKSLPVFGRSGLLAGVWVVYIAGAGIAAAAISKAQALAPALPTALIAVVVLVAAISFPAPKETG